VFLLHKLFQCSFLTGLITNGVNLVGGHIIMFLIFLYLCIYFVIRYIVHQPNNVLYAVVVHTPAKFNLGFDLVTLCYSYIAHIVTNAQHTQPVAFKSTHCRAHPATDTAAKFFVLPPTRNDFFLQTHTGDDKPVLSVTVSGLVQIHKVHVDFIPRNITVKLCINVQQRFLQYLQTMYPHF